MQIWKQMLTAAATASLLFTANASFAGNQQYLNQVRHQFSVIKQKLLRKGFQETHRLKLGKLNHGYTDEYTFQLKRDWQYAIVSACDGDCPDIDLTLYDENGQRISTDTSSDSMPIVSARPQWSGRFKLQVNMYRCHDNPCYFGIGIFGTPTNGNSSSSSSSSSAASSSTSI